MVAEGGVGSEEESAEESGCFLLRDASFARRALRSVAAASREEVVEAMTLRRRQGGPDSTLAVTTC